MSAALEMFHITKRFGQVVANNDINFKVDHGEIVALLGENGSGKTTLMNMVSGIYRPDEGQIFIDGNEVKIASPKDAIDLKIGMIHQHFKLVDIFTAAENIVLGLDKEFGKLSMEEINQKVKEISNKYGFEIDPKKKIYDMSVSEKQTVEIIKVLFRGANILILDEPTAVLTPQETDKLFDIIKNMKQDNKAIIMITHKLNEVLAVSDKVVILRKGEYIDEVKTSEADVQSLTNMMVGKPMELEIERPTYEKIYKAIEVEHLTVKNADGVNALSDVSFTAYGGEILGIAGIAGSGQKELLEAVAGLTKMEEGSKITYYENEGANPIVLNGMSPRQLLEKKILLSFVPEDRFGMGLVGSLTIVENVMIRTYYEGKGPFLDLKKPTEMAEKIVELFDVDTPNIDKIPIRKLSGGNVQKVLVGREIASEPKVLMTAYAVRGLDINTSFVIYDMLTAEKMKGTAVVYVGEDLDVLLQFCDKILVLCDGQISGIVDAKETTKEQIGLLMTTVGGK